jgi:hypothetical protein
MELNSTTNTTGRKVATIGVVLGLLGAIAPALTNMDLSSTAGIFAGLAAIVTIAVKYLEGSQRYEERLDAAQTAAAGVPPVEAPSPTDGDVADPGETDDDPVVDDDEQPGTVVPLPTQLSADELADVPRPPTDDEIDALTADVIAADVIEDRDRLELAS